MGHESLGRRDEAAAPTERSFGLVFTAVFGIVAGLPLLFGQAPRLWALALAAAFLAVTLVAPRRLAPLNRLWHRFGQALHHVVNPVILGAMYFLILTPVGVVMRLLGKDPLRLRADPSAATYWIDRDLSRSPTETFKDQF